ncbi:zinc ribbon domain-containing protein [Sphingomonas sp. CLY1604]|uniref:zinc ribbon domain-containing protein n=1 Tax=Sphingomonas sp. CLY1604 TaxID=3457786 RepID=UPI003FD7F7EB
MEVAVPDLRIIDDTLFEAARGEIERRKRPATASSSIGSKRAKHLLSGIIRCSCCGSNCTISGKDYYRCAGQKERGTCGNTVSVRKEPLETATLAMLQTHLLTEDHARLFVQEFRREAARLARGDGHRNEAAHARLRQLEVELANLYQNLLVGIASPALQTMIREREAEKIRLEARLHGATEVKPRADILPHPVLVDQFRRKVAALRASLDDDAIRPEASAVLARLIESVTIYPDGEDGPEAEVVAKVADLIAYAANENTRPGDAKDGRSIPVVAGTGFEPVTFRL